MKWVFSKKAMVLGVVASLVAVAGMAAATGALFPRSIWGDDNPGQGAQHAAMPQAGAEHNKAGAAHMDNRSGHGEEDGNETDGEEGPGDDGNATDEEGLDDDEDAQDESDREAEDESEGGAEALSYLRAVSVDYGAMGGNDSDVNWSRNWTRGNVTCQASGNRTSGTLTCQWPDMEWSRRGLNCSLTGGSLTVSWAPGNFTKTWTGGTLSCTWMGGAWQREAPPSHDEATDESLSGG